MNLFMRAYAETTAEGDGPIRFVASTEGVARDGLVIEAGAWNLDNYRRNPVVLWAHDYMGRNLPIGRADVNVEDGKLVADVVFDRSDPFAELVERKYRAGFLHAVSVGWDTQDFKPPRTGEAGRITRADLLDISAVPVPSDPNALMERMGQGARSVVDWLIELDKPEADEQPRSGGPIAPHSTRKAPEDAPMGAQNGLQRAHCAWCDDDRCELPHHLETGEVVWAGVAAAMARLLSDGAGIPDEDRRGTYVHLERHYRQFNRTAPEYLEPDALRALTSAEVRGLFLEGEDQYLQDDQPCDGNDDSLYVRRDGEFSELYASFLKGLAGRIGK